MLVISGPEGLIIILLVIVDTTAAPALYVVGHYYSWSLCSSLK